MKHVIKWLCRTIFHIQFISIYSRTAEEKNTCCKYLQRSPLLFIWANVKPALFETGMGCIQFFKPMPNMQFMPCGWLVEKRNEICNVRLANCGIKEKCAYCLLCICHNLSWLGLCDMMEPVKSNMSCEEFPPPPQFKKIIQNQSILLFRTIVVTQSTTNMIPNMQMVNKNSTVPEQVWLKLKTNKVCSLSMRCYLCRWHAILRIFHHLLSYNQVPDGSYNQAKTSTFIHDFHVIFKWKTTYHRNVWLTSTIYCSVSMWAWCSYLE